MHRRTARWAPWILLAAVFAAYHNSFRNPFIFDGRALIQENLKIRSLWPIGEMLEGSARPFTRFSFGLNYAVGGLDVFGYHVVNFIVHVLASWVLFGLFSRTFLSPRMRKYEERPGPGTALAAALLWAVHPLQTESVTYVYQRAESLMSLFYLLTLYALARAAQKPEGGKWWLACSWGACLIGMSCKAVMVTAPLMALLYDRVFWAASWKEIRLRRGGFYLLLSATWILLAWIVSSPHESRSSVGWSMQWITPIDYALSQCGVILHYLRLSLWPSVLVLDYVWPPVQSRAEALLSAVFVAAAAGAAILAFRRRPEWGFLGAWFFIILLPTSSFFPIADLAVEHRMYLPLASAALLFVLAGRGALRRLASSEGSVKFLRIWVLSGLVLTLILRTAERNFDYRSPYAMWNKVAQQRPSNPRAHANLGVWLEKRGRTDEAITAYRKAFRILQADPSPSVDPDLLYSNLAASLIKKGKYGQAVDLCRKAIEINPYLKEARANLAIALARQGKPVEARRELSEALEIYPDSTRLRKLMGLLSASAGE